MINFLKKARATTWIAFVIHLFVFSAIAWQGVDLWGFDWKYILVAIVIPCYFFYQNIKEYDCETNNK